MTGDAGAGSPAGAISVVMPVYNRAAMLPRAIDSVLADARVSKLAGFEIIVVDDGSSDGSAEVAAAYGHPVRVISQANQGCSAARNAGLAAARGEYVRTVDSDDWLSPGISARQLRTMAAHDADVCHASWHDAFERNGTLRQDPRVRRMGAHADVAAALIRGHWAPPFAYLYRRAALEAIGRWRTERVVQPIEDLALNLPLAIAGRRFVEEPSVAGWYRHHDGPSLSQDSLRRWCDAKWTILCDARKLMGPAELDAARRAAFGHAYLELAKNYAGVDRERFHASLRMLREIAPDYRPAGRAYRAAVALAGYERVERLLAFRRRLTHRKSR